MKDLEKQYVVMCPYRQELYVWDEYAMDLSKKANWDFVTVDEHNWGDVVHLTKAVVIGEL